MPTPNLQPEPAAVPVGPSHADPAVPAPSAPAQSQVLGELLGEAEREEVARQERERVATRLPVGLD
jgi:hypothetical protein